MNSGQLFQRAVAHHQAGQFALAEAIYRQIVALEPARADAFHLLGLACHQLGRAGLATGFLRRAIAIQPGIAAYHHDLGAIFRALGRLEDARACYQAVVRLEPDSFEALFDLGTLHKAAGRFDEASNCFERVVSVCPECPEGWANLTVTRRAEGLLDEALVCASHALELRPEEADSHLNLGAVLLDQGKAPAARECFEAALRLDESCVTAHINLGIALLATGQATEAMGACHRALALAPDHGRAWFNLGNAAYALHRWSEAEIAFAESDRCEPGQAKTLLNLGAAIKAGGRGHAALAWYDAALALEPGSPLIRFNRAVARLQAGDFVGGWGDYEARWQAPGLIKPLRPCALPVWDGRPLNGQRIFLRAEQGFGDTLQFVRYASLIADRGGEVILESQPSLKRLLRSVPGIRAVVGQDEPLPAADWQIPLMSLPGLLGTTLESIPAATPYLAAVGADLFALPAAVPGTLKVGLVWAGNPAMDEDRLRSLALSQLRTLLATPGVTFYSLQAGLKPEDASTLKEFPQVHEVGSRFRDFAETATAINQLDLVISVCTSVCHLAGAMGKETWTLLAHVPCWRWLLEREDSPWYPGMRLFRQRVGGDWKSVCARVKEELVNRVRGLRGTPSVESAEELFQTGLNQHARGNLGAAVEFYRQALVADGRHVSAWLNLGTALKESRKLDEAGECFARANELAPADPGAANGLGIVCQAAGQLEAAIAWYRVALTRRWDCLDAQLNLAIALRETGALTESMAWLRRAIARYPDCAEAHWNLGFAQLLTGDFAQGWQEYEWRWQLAEPRARQIEVSAPRWLGQDLRGRSILLRAEQGFGDTLQFVRYAPLLAERGARVILECQPELVSLLSQMRGIDQVVPRGNALPACDFQIPLLSLPLVCQTRLDTIPAASPYLFAPAPGASLAMPAHLGRLQIGLVWGGNSAYRNDRQRSFSLAEYLPLLANQDVDFHSLQTGSRAREIVVLNQAERLCDWSACLADFTATAALIGQLDLVITSDTSVAHLAGALGKPAWVLLSHAPDWRWLRERNDSPWYPGMRLFRQGERGDWAGVVERVRSSLLDLLTRQASRGPLPVVVQAARPPS